MLKDLNFLKYVRRTISISAYKIKKKYLEKTLNNNI